MQEAAEYADPTTEPFWDAARDEQLVIQRCADCGKHQFYPRPFCLGCDSTEVTWVPASGFGTVYSTTRVHLDADPALGLPNPYDVAIVELAEGPRMLTNLTDPCPIGGRVKVAWRDRGNQPPVPVFGPAPGGDR
jgi:uncharacterized OB-fold protein